ncbi:MAG: hypothetical protein NTW42_07870 [Deltaproteobacteria bacterium]|nr:hypothetical protein [Deltaproteobacteria bacterium]
MATNLSIYSANAQKVVKMFGGILDSAATADLVAAGTAHLDAGGSEAAIYTVLLNAYAANSGFANFASTASNADFAAAVVTKMVTGTSVSAATQTAWTSLIAGALPAYATRGDAMVALTSLINNYTGADADLLATKAVFANRAEVGAHYALSPAGAVYTAISQLTAPCAVVTDAAASVATAIAATPGVTIALTAGADIPTLTTANDTLTGALATLTANDIIVDTSSTDSDTMNLTMNAINGAATVTKIENINVDWTGFTAALFDATNVTGATVAINSTKLGFAGTSTITAAGANTFNFGTGMTGVQTVNGLTTGTVNAAAATGVSVAGTSALTDAATVVANGTLSITNAGTLAKLTVNNKVAANTITVDAITTNLTVTGSVATTIKTTAAAITTETVTNSLTAGAALTVETTGAAAGNACDISKVGANSFVLGAGLNASTSLTVATGAVLAASADLTACKVTGAAATDVATLNNTAALQTSIASSSIKTLTVNSAATAVAGVDATYSTLNVGTNDVKLTGTNDVKVTNGTAATADASALVGALTYTAITGANTTVKGGSGANVITLNQTTQNATYTGQNGGDTITTLVTTGTTTITAGTGNNTVTASGIMAGLGVLDVTTGSGNDTITANAATTGTISATLGNGTNSVSATGLTSGIMAIVGGTGVDTITTSGLTTGTLSATLGDGNDVVNLGAGASGAAIIAIDFGTGTADTLQLANAGTVAAASLSATGLDIIKLTSAGSMTFDAAQLSGKTYTLQGSGTATDYVNVTTATAGVVNLSTLTFDGTLANGMQITHITGNAGADTITGTAGVDIIATNGGADTVTAGLGADVITCGGGVDTLVFAQGDNAATTAATADTILAFATTVDKIKTGLAGTTASEFTSAAGTSTWTFAQALTAANVVFAAANAQSYYMTSYGTAGTDAQGVLFMNMDNNATADGCILVNAAAAQTMAQAAALCVAGDIIA